MYIKTNDGLYEMTNGREIVERWDIADNPHLIEYEYNHSTEENDEYDLGVFIAQSENLAELCDRYVGITNNKPMIIKYEFDEYYDEYGDSYTKEELLMEYDIIYGCIWVEIKLPNNKTVFRLEPVVIMNDEGNFELI